MRQNARAVCSAIAALTLLAFATLGSAATGPATTAYQSVLTSDEVAAVEAAVRQLREEEEIPGLSLAIARDGQIVLTRGFGTISLDGARPATADTRYRIASVSKSVTAVAVLQLAAAGLLDLDDAAHLHCPTYPEKEPPPTIRHLLAHQSGIRHTTDREDTTFEGEPDRLANVIPRFASERLEFEPGTETLYTSWGYTLLGCVIETVTGQPYFDYVSERILQPAAMASTGADRPNLVRNGFSPGFRLRGSRIVAAEIVDTRFKIPASGLVSTAPDLVRFTLALYDQTLLDAQWIDELFRIQRTRDGDPTSYTPGFIVSNQATFGASRYMSGSMEGTTALLWVIPERRFTVAILTNRERFVQEIVPLLRLVMAALLS